MGSFRTADDALPGQRMLVAVCAVQIPPVRMHKALKSLDPSLAVKSPFQHNRTICWDRDHGEHMRLHLENRYTAVGSKTLGAAPNEALLFAKIRGYGKHRHVASFNETSSNSGLYLRDAFHMKYWPQVAMMN